MKVSKEKSRIKQINVWVQTVALICAFVWGIYTFVYKEILLPKSAPVNISMNLGLQCTRNNESNQKKSIPVELIISAKNPSTRQVDLLSNFFIIYGIKVNPAEKDLIADYKKNPLKGNTMMYTEKYRKIINVTVVAFGGLFSDDSIKPVEEIKRNLFVDVPYGKFDRIRAAAYICSVRDSKGLYMQWSLDDNGDAVPLLYRINAKGEQKLIERNKDGSYVDEVAGVKDLLAFRSVAELSL